MSKFYLLALILAHLLSEAGCMIINCELDRTRMNFLFWTPVASQWPFRSFRFKNVSIFICSSPSSSLSKVSQFITFDHIRSNGHFEITGLFRAKNSYQIHRRWQKQALFLYMVCLSSILIQSQLQ